MLSVCGGLLSLALATDSQAPVISLDLAGKEDLISVCRTKEQWDTLINGGTPHWDHLHGCSPNSETYAKRCEVMVDNEQSCPEPEASAYDHHEGNVDVLKTLTLEVVLPARAPQPIRANMATKTIDYKTRGEYMFFWDAVDRSGNQAERVHFAMIMQDTTPPAIQHECLLHGHSYGHIPAKLQSGLGWSPYLRLNASAVDLFDGDVSDTMTIVSEGNVVTEGRSVNVSTLPLGESSVTYKAHDFANIFGKNNKDNQLAVKHTFEVVDTLAPEILCKNKQSDKEEPCKVVGEDVQCDQAKSCELAPIFHKCGAKFVDHGAFCMDQRDSWEASATYMAEQSYKLAPSKILPEVKYSHQHEFMGEDTIYYTCTDSQGNAITKERRVIVNDWKPPDVRVLDTSNLNLIAEFECDAGQVNNDILTNATTLMTGYEAETTCHTFIDTCEVEYFKGNCDGEFECEATGGPQGLTKCSGTGEKITKEEMETGLNTCTTDESKIEVFAVKYTCRDATNTVAKCRTLVAVEKATETIIIINFAGLPASTIDQPESFIKAVVAVVADKLGSWFTHDFVELLHAAHNGRRLAEPAGTGFISLVFRIKHADSATSFMAFMRNGFAAAYTALCEKFGLEAPSYLNGILTFQAVIKSVTVESLTLPIVEIEGGNVVTVEGSKSPHATYTDEGATCSDVKDGVIYSNQPGAGHVDLARLGEYELEYPCANSGGFKAINTFRFVYIQDTKVPVCSLVGRKYLTIEASFPFVDPGVTCVDEFDGDVSAVVSHNIDVEKTGTYQVTYSVTDHSGNADRVVRTVVVQDTLKPVIALTSLEKDAAGSPVLTDQPIVSDHDAANPAVAFWKKPMLGSQQQVFNSIFQLQNTKFMVEVRPAGAHLMAAFVAATVGVALFARTQTSLQPTTSQACEVNIAAV